MLHALIDFAYREGLAAEPGFGPKTLHWAVEIGRDGRFLGMLRLGPEGKGLDLVCAPFLAADEIKNQSATSVGCQPFWEDAEKLFLWTDGAPKKSVVRRHNNFLRLLEEAASDLEEVKPAVVFFQNSAFCSEAIEALKASSSFKPKRTNIVTFRVDGGVLADSSAVKAWWRDRYARFKGVSGDRDKKNAGMVDLLTGRVIAPARTHPTKIKGLGSVGGRGMGDALISFDKESFNSYGLEKSFNAAMSAESAKLYAEALNKLIEGGRVLAGAKVVPWFKKAIPKQLSPMDALFGFDDDNPMDDAKGAEEEPKAPSYGKSNEALAIERQANAGAVRFLESFRTGKEELLDKSNHYYALTLSGASGRVMVRDWMEGPFPDLVRAVVAWFEDLSIVHPSGLTTAPPPKFMAAVGGMVRELRDAPAPLIASLWRAAARREPIPAAAHARALARARVAFIAGETPRLAGVALLKAFHCRLPRSSSGDNIMLPYLNPDHPEPAYHCGRLLAVLAELQRTALGDVGAGVVQRFYVAFSQSPALIFGRLIGNAKNHLNKLKPGVAFRIEESIAEITGRLGDGLPTTLQLTDQSLFALGYYQQLAYQRKQAADNSAAKKAKNIGTSVDEDADGQIHTQEIDNV
ncbi:CRISPR-associated protein Csd1 [Azospirillaceae bacterium]